MSKPEEFPNVAAALEAFAAGRCKRWVSVEGHQIDLVQAQAEAGRVREEPGGFDGSKTTVDLPEHACEAWDRCVAQNVAAELARASGVLPELAVPEVPAPPPVECCRACGRPLIGAVP